MPDTEKPDLAALTVQLLSAYFSNNTVPAADIPNIIETTRTALSGEQAAPAPVEPEHVPAVSARKSLASRDHIVSMIDGKAYKMLKRHLATNGLTPDEYRARYKLPKSYPMVAPNYAEQRRAVAAKIGLGQRRAQPKTAEAPAPTETKPAPVETAPKRVPAKKAPAPEKAEPKAAPVVSEASVPAVEATPKRAIAKKAAAPSKAGLEAAPAKAAPAPKAARSAPKVKATTAPKAAATPKASPAPESVAEATKPASSPKRAGKSAPAKRGAKVEPVAAATE